MSGPAAAAAALMSPSSLTAVAAASMPHHRLRSTSVGAPRTAGPPLAATAASKRTRPRCVLARITNEGRELKLQPGNPVDDNVELVQLPDGTWAPLVNLYDKFVDLGPQYQVPYNVNGPLERSVATQYLDGLFDDIMDLEQMEYWFSRPPEGWNTERKVLVKAERADYPKAQQALRPLDEPDAKTRRPLASLRVGEVLEGTVCGQGLSTGVHVDVGASHNGLLPVRTDYLAWTRPPPRGLAGRLRIGEKCTVRVGKVIAAPLCRFPLVLEVVGAPELEGAFVPTEEYRGAFDLRGAPGAADHDLGDDELDATMDALTGGNFTDGWPTGAGIGASIPLPMGGAAQGNRVDAAQRAIEDGVKEWLVEAGTEAKARAAAAARASGASGAAGAAAAGAGAAAGGGGESGGDESGSESETVGGETSSGHRRKKRRDEYAHDDDDDDDDDRLIEMSIDDRLKRNF